MKGTIKRRRDFLSVYEQGQKAFGEYVVVFGLRAEAVAPSGSGERCDEAVRVGIVASRKVGNAVRRNRAKRVLRAAVQPLLPYFPPGSCVVLVARRSLASLEVRSNSVQHELTELLARIGMLEDDPA